MKNIHHYLSALLLVFLIFSSSCGNQEIAPIEIGNNEKAEMANDNIIQVTQSQFELAKMKLGKLKEHNFPSTIQATGRIEIPPKNHIRVSSYAGGYVTSINLIPDQYVTRGQVLFTLENPEFVQMQQDYLEAKEQLSYLKSDYERQKILASENVASEKNYLKAESDYKVTLAQMEGMKKRLSMIKINTDNISPQNLITSIPIFAPANGHISEVHAMKGMFLNPTDIAVAMIDDSHMHLELNVFEKDILKLKKGQNITFKIPDASDELFEAEVYLIGKTIDEEKRVIRVHGHFKHHKDQSRLVAGMYVDAEIIIDANPSKGLPETAIVTEDNKDFILIYKGEKEEYRLFEKKAVKIGQRKGGFVQIVNEEEWIDNSEILVEGAFNLIGIE
jgi:cobalt-zinc-cadmium efflux system membrane fusion protein